MVADSRLATLSLDDIGGQHAKTGVVDVLALTPSSKVRPSSPDVALVLPAVIHPRLASHPGYPSLPHEPRH